jgi:hypothetical protein
MSPLKNRKSSQLSYNLKVEEAPEIHENQFEREGTHNDSKHKNEENELIIKQCEVPQANYYSFKNKGGTLGRNGANQIPISDEFVSRYHAEIIFEN